MLGAPKFEIFDDPPACPGFVLGESMNFFNYKFKLFLPSSIQIITENLLKPKSEELAKVEAKKQLFWIFSKNMRPLEKIGGLKICSNVAIVYNKVVAEFYFG